MKKFLWILIVIAIVVLGGYVTFTWFNPFAKNTPPEIQLGKKLEEQFWVDMTTRNWGAIENKLADGFQSIHEDGARNRDQEIKLIKGLKLEKYKLSNFKISRNGPIIVVTYEVASHHEIIDGDIIPKTPSTRSSVWLMTDKGWQWIHHANLARLKK
ncbi:MAG: nuclear transport factor 2 family protein [Candidatus Ancaeobacter aquaticus]|nr:nuclear transport factor 2 family protein [Candidatus Ancaeobacter aquaticus]